MGNVNNFWREIDSIEVTHSMLHYLFAISQLIEKNGYARTVDISKDLKITAGSCSVGLKNLLAKWLIQEQNNKFFTLTEQGQKVVVWALRKRTILHDFFTQKLWLSEDVATKNACKIEHLVDTEIIEKLENFIK